MSEVSGCIATPEAVPSGALMNLRSERFVEVYLNFLVDDSFDPEKLIEIRIWVERAVFHGQIAIGRVKLTPQGDVPIEMKAYFESALSS